MLKIEAERHGKTAILKLEGSFDREGSKTLREAMQEQRQAGYVRLILDCSHLIQIQNAFLKDLLTPLRAITLVQGKVGFSAMSHGVHKIIQTTLFYPYIQVFDTTEDALNAFESTDTK